VFSDLGVSIADALQLLSYDEVEYFVEEYSKRKRKRDISEALNRVSEMLLVFQSSMPSGIKALAKWQRDNLDELRNLDVMINGTVFERLKLMKGRKKQTVFDRLKAMKK